MTTRQSALISAFFLVIVSSLSIVAPARSFSNDAPSAAVLGRYVLWSDAYWNVANKTAQQLSGEGYPVQSEPNQLLTVNYTRLNYTFKSKITKLDWPNVTVELTEGEYDLNVTAHKILESGTMGEKLGSFLREDQPSRIGRTYETWAPTFGPGYDPSALRSGNNFTVWLEYSVSGPEILHGTPWGQNETYVLHGESANATHSLSNRIWCDSASGLILRQTLDMNIQGALSHEEQLIIETGIDETKSNLPDPLLILGVASAIVIAVVVTAYVWKTRRRKA